ncbi:MAG TPA: tetratricopeptide repeat protein [Longimicrobiales bacterium]|nr:tetratricopeptide repeat protein [Longimicrobiales bacterium]
MPAPSLWDRLRGARIVQVLLVYLGASWAVLQIADVLTEALSLPGWVLPVAVLLLLVGLVIILATAWVQSLPATTAKEEAGEIPTDWQVAPSEALASLKAGKLPHLTWGRAILGGVVALSLLFGGAGAYVLVTGSRVPGLGPADLGADVAAAGIAVLPFAVTGGEDLDLWREGMVDVLSTNLDGMGGYRTIDARTVMARWHEQVGGDDAPDLRTALEVAGATGARFGLLGNLVGNPGGVRVAADVYDLSTGNKVTQSYVEGPADSVLALVNRLTVGITRELLAAGGQQVMQAPRAASITTESLEALRHYLDGEVVYRKADFAGAAAAYERATEADSTFALAWYRLYSAYGWLEDLNSDVVGRAGRRVEELADRLPMRERALVLAVQRGVNEGDLSAISDFRQAASKYPDDPEVWYELGEFYLHVGIPAGIGTSADALDALQRAVELDPSFGPYYIHLIERLVAAGKGAEALDALASYQALVGSEAQPHLGLAVALFGQDPAARADALAALDTVSDIVTDNLRSVAPWYELPDAVATEEVLKAMNGGRLPPTYLVSRGRIHEAGEGLADRSVEPWRRVSQVAQLELLGIAVPPELVDATRDLDVCPDREDAGENCMFLVGALAAVRGDRATWKMWVDRNHSLGATYERDGQGAHGKEHEALARALEGLWAWYQDKDPRAAREHLSAGVTRLPGAMGYATRIHLAEVLADENPREAEAQLERMGSGVFTAYAMVRLGRLREGLGDVDGAKEAYQQATELFRNADDDLSYAVEAREALGRLGT